MKEVRFDIWCKRCKYWSNDEFDPDFKNPCYDCLENPATDNSHKPVRFVSKDAKRPFAKKSSN